MSDFVEYKPMDVEHNVKAAVENLRKAYWSNDTKKVAKIFTDAESIIVSAICHDTYTVCKPDAERTQGDLISRGALLKAACVKFYTTPYYKHILDLIDNAPTVEIPKHSLLPLAGDCDEAYMRGYNHGKAEGILKAHTRPKGEWIPIKQWDNTHIWVCSECGNQNRHGITVEKACWKCGADMRGGAE